MARFLANIQVEIEASSPQEAARKAVLEVVNRPQVDVGLDCPGGRHLTLGVNEDPRIEPVLVQGDLHAVH